MLKNYISITWRHARLHKWYAAIKLASLTLGLSVFSLVLIFIFFELSFDRFHKNSKDIYRILSQVPESYMGKNLVAVTPGILAPTLRKEFPEVLKATRIEKRKVTIENNLDRFSETGFICADHEFLEIFSFPFLKGNAKEVLQQPFTILLTEKTARKYFGDQEAVGKTLLIDKHLYTVEGILKNLPANTILQFDFITSFATTISLDGQESENSWDNWEYYTFVLLSPGSEIGRFNEKLTELRKRYYDHGNQTLFLQSLTDMRHFTMANFEFSNPMNPKFMYLLFGTGLFILIIACLNYISLATAYAINRSKETGLRKVAGAGRKQLVIQFLTEAVAFSVISLIFTFLIVYLMLPAYGSFIGQKLESSMVFKIQVAFTMIIVAISVGLLSGLYPAFVISSFKPIVVLKGEKKNLRGNLIRNVLVVFQLAVSIILIFGSLVTYGQFKYLIKKDLGYNKDLVVCVRFFDGKARMLMAELKTNVNILDVVVSNQLPCEIGNASFAYWEGKSGDHKPLFYKMEIDKRFLDFYQIPVVRSDNSLLEAGSGNSFILNQTAAHEIGWSDPIGKRFGFDGEDNNKLGVVGGVIRDFNFTSLKLKVGPLALSFIDNNVGLARGWLSAKVNSNNLPETLKFIKETWEKQFPEAIFEYSFMDDRIEETYRSERKLNISFLSYTLIAILIAGLGLFGLATFLCERKKREIGIRKVFGAEINSIIKMFVIYFLELSAMAVIFALPAGYFIMQNWLKGFAYHINPGWDLWILSAGVTLLIVFLTVIYKIRKAAHSNPVDIIKYE